MAHHHEDLSQLSASELKYREYMQMGDYFLKMPIYRNAKEWYAKALAMRANDDAATQKIKDCKLLISKETKLIIVVLVIAALVTSAILFAKGM